MKKTLFSSLFFLFVLTNGWAQSNDVLMTIGDQKISKDEFVRIYMKNNTVDSESSKSVDDYLGLFINFKLKVHDAQQQGLDTVPSFVKELDGYNKQLIKPYLTDSNVDNQLIKEAYERMHYDIKASHILIILTADATAKDTMIAYNKAWKIYNELKSGKPFAEEAQKYSEDKQTAMKGGNLGYFTVFQMIYPFETVAFNTQVGQFSEPVRTRFGYHIIKVTDKRQNKGKVKVAHIMVTYPQGADKNEIQKAKLKIDSIYQKLQNGGDFAKLAEKYSEDKGTARKGGELNWFGTGQMVPAFENAAFQIKNIGDYNKPIKTSFGWHIIKLLDREPIKPFDEVKYEIKNKISKDARAQKSRDAVLKKLKKEYNFTYDKKALSNFYKVVNDSIFFGKWKISQAKNLNKTLFTFDGKNYSQQEYASHLANQKRKLKIEPIRDYINKDFTDFTDQFILDYYTSKLPTLFPEFKYLMKEYHDGILLFNLMDKNVWTKAIKDTVGLRVFYEKTKNNYMWGTRVKATIFEAENSKIASKLAKVLKSKAKKNLTNIDILDILNKKDSTAVIIKTEGTFSKGDNDDINKLDKTYHFFNNTKNNVPIISVNDNMVIEIFEIIPPQPKALKDIKGLIIAEYQNQLEKDWIASLKEKYKINVNRVVFNEIKKEIH